MVMEGKDATNVDRNAQQLDGSSAASVDDPHAIVVSMHASLVPIPPLLNQPPNWC